MKLLTNRLKNTTNLTSFQKSLINDYSDLIELINNKLDNDNIEDVTGYYELRDIIDYDGSLHELIDGSIDLYNYDLRVWAVDNYDYVELAIDEGLTEGVNDFHKLIQAGQFCFYRANYNKAVEFFADVIIGDYNE